MTRSQTLTTRLLLGGLAGIGVVGGHMASYLLVTPHPDQRHDLLEATGHQQWSGVVAAAALLFIGGFVVFVAARLSSPSGAIESTLGLCRYAAVRLAVLQVAGFLSMEAVERAASGGGLGTLWTEPAVLVGTAVQLLLAVGLAAILVLVSRGVRWLERLLHSRSPVTSPTRVGSLASLLSPPRPQVGTGSGSLRGPPTVKYL